MKSALHTISAYIRYFIRSKTIYQIHSPFLYDFLNTTRDKTKLYYQFQPLDDLRRLFLLDETIVEDDDPGAGSRNKNSVLRVKDVAKTALSSRDKCEWLYRTMLFLQPTSILELGTSLGLSAMYMASAIPDGKVVTLEGRPSIVRYAQKAISSSSIGNVTVVEGLFDDRLPNVINSLDPIDFVVLDGNHRYEPTMKYARAILSKHQPTAMLVDDIYWSKGMTKAWHELKDIPQFNVALDFFDYGLLLHRPEIEERIDISYIDYWKNFWKMGFWT